MRHCFSHHLIALCAVVVTSGPAAAEELHNLGIRQRCLKIEMAGAKLGSEKKSNERYLYCESTFGLDWVELDKYCKDLRTSLKPRGWNSQNGKYHVFASLETINFPSVELKKSDSSEKVITIAIDKLDEQGQSLIKKVESEATKLKNAAQAIDERRNARTTAEQLTDEELTTLYAAQSKALPSKFSLHLDKMLADPTVVESALEKAHLPPKTSDTRRILLLKTTTLASLAKARYQHPRITDAEWKIIGGDKGWYDRFENGSDEKAISVLLMTLVDKPGAFEGPWGDAFRREWGPLMEELAK